MAIYHVTGIWRDLTNRSGSVSHYSVHKVESVPAGTSLLTADRVSYEDLLNLVEDSFNDVSVLKWDYDDRKWIGGDKVFVKNINHTKVLTTSLTDARVDYLKNLPDHNILFKI